MKTILIANQKGGCGKTLVVDELAFSFDRTDVKYSLYDLDGQGGIIHEPKVIDDADYAIVDTPGYISDKKVRLQLNVYQKNARAISFYQREEFIIRCEGLDEATGEKEYTMLWKQK